MCIVLTHCTWLHFVGTHFVPSFRPSNTEGSSEELRADPNALANGAYDAPSKPYKGRKTEAAPSGPPSSDRPLAGKPNMSMHAGQMFT